MANEKWQIGGEVRGRCRYSKDYDCEGMSGVHSFHRSVDGMGDVLTPVESYFDSRDRIVVKSLNLIIYYNY